MEFVESIRTRVDAVLEEYLESKRRDVASLSPRSILLAEGVRDLTLRGGKRLRPVVLAAAHLAVAPEDSRDKAIRPGAALELLQSYLLIHDDWMDGDLRRRGGPSTHAVYRETVGDDHLGDSLGVLAGDLAGTWAWELMLGADYPPRRHAEALRAFVRIQEEVYLGQHLDLVGDSDVPLMQDLKTGSYTVRGPLRLGALLGDATDAQLEALRAYGDPLGEAFQLRDDLLGTFGSVEETGKPGDDLAHGKETAVIAEARRSLDEEAMAAVQEVLEAEAPTEAALERATEALIEGGIRDRIESRLADLRAASEAALERAPLAEEGRRVLSALADKLAMRSR